MAEAALNSEILLETPLSNWHRANGGKMVPFAGYAMPVQYAEGLMAEHAATREAAGLFDVSHMGQAFLISDSYEKTALALEALIPADALNLKPGQQRYSQLLNDQGGILDDLMFTRVEHVSQKWIPVLREKHAENNTHEGWIYLVVNAGCKEADYAHIAARLPEGVSLKRADNLALIALQGPKAEDVLASHIPEVRDLAFMHYHSTEKLGYHLHISRSGYTGEDGFEISVSAEKAVEFWELLASHPSVKPVGLGARDTLRLEGGMCLYGHDIDETTSPIEAGLNWSIQKRRREEGGFPGAARIQSELQNGPVRRRVGLKPEGRAPIREGAEIADSAGTNIGRVTSGTFSPTLQSPICMGYVAATHSANGSKVQLLQRGKAFAAEVVALPFIPNRFKR